MPPVKNNRNTSQILFISLAHLLHDVFSGFFVPLLPLIIKKHRLSLTLASLLSVIQRLPSLFNPIFGYYADRLPLKPFVIWGPAITVVAMSLFGMAPNFGILALLLFITGLGVCSIHVPGPVLIARNSGNRIGQGMAFFMVGGESARTIAPLIALSATTAWGLSGLWHLLPIAFIVLLFLQWKLIEPTYHSHNKTFGSLRDAWNRLKRPFAAIIGQVVARSFAMAAMTTFLPTLLVSKNQSLWFAGIALTVLEASGVVGALTGGSFSDRLGRKNVLAITSIAIPPLMLAFLYLDGVFLFAALLGFGFFGFATNPVLMALVQDHAGDQPALANGIYMSLNFGVRSLIVLSVGIMADYWGLDKTFLISGLLAFLGLPFLLLLPSDRSKRLND